MLVAECTQWTVCVTVCVGHNSPTAPNNQPTPPPPSHSLSILSKPGAAAARIGEGSPATLVRACKWVCHQAAQASCALH